MPRSSLLAILCLLGFAVESGTVQAQSSVASQSRLHAIVDARVELGNGTVLERATILISNGFITAVGPDLKIPAGAEVLAGKGLTVYPGFIDAYTTRGVKATTTPNRQDDAPSMAEFASAAMREGNRKEVHPEYEARQNLDLNEGVRKPYLEAGFTTIMAVPDGIGLKGLGTLVNLSGRAARESVVVPKTGFAVQWGASGFGDQAYPASLLGSLAQFRQALSDRQTRLASLRPSASRRVPSDPAMEALTDGIARPFFVEADTPAEIDRVGRIGEEYKLSTVIVGALQGWRRPDRLADHPLILSLSPAAEPKAPEPPAVPKPGEKPADTPEADPDEPTFRADDPVRTAERKRQFQEVTANAAELDRAGVKFAFTTRGAKDIPSFMAALRRAVTAGLPRTVALQALTSRPAQILGVGNLGTIVPGAIANLAVMTGDFLDEKTKTKMLYIDGWRIDPTARPVPGSAPRPAGRGEL